MRVALVNNGTKNSEKLHALLNRYEVVDYSIDDADQILSKQFDLIVLSGSSRFPIAYNLDQLTNELRLITETTVPLLGICFGAELLTVAYGGTLKDTGHTTKGILTVSAKAQASLFNGQEAFDVYEAHRWIIDTVPEELEVLACSETGPEIIRHKTKSQYGFQFHPEKMCDETYGDELFFALLTALGLPASTEDRS